MEMGEIVLISVFLGVSEILRLEVKKVKSFRSLIFFLAISAVIVIFSLFVTWELLIVILAVFVVHLYLFLKGFLSEVLVTGEKEKQESERKVDVWKVMSSSVFPSYDREILKRLVVEVGKIGS